MLRSILVLSACASAAAFAPSAAPSLSLRSSPAVQRGPARHGLATVSMQAKGNPMAGAVEKFASENPELASRGLGVTTNAERWNGRHAMFGIFFMVLSSYLHGRGLIPDADKVLDVSQWGPLVNGGFNAPITNERAIILVAHIHVLFVSILAAFAPFGFQDTLVKEKGYKPEAPAGIIPAFKTGLTSEAELINGRLAMLGVISITTAALFTGTPISDVINLGLGKILY